jgi:hypothetical protein
MLKKKLKIITYLIMSIAITLTFTNCQEEYVDIDEPDKSKTISANDAVAGLIYKIILKDGSFDNIIDRCSEISIEFPYSIQIEEQNYTFNSKEDIDAFMINYFHLRDDFDINYPITVSFSDYSEGILYNDDELEQIQELFNIDLIDDDIECINFVYPIELNVFNTEYQKTDVIVANDDYDIFDIFDDISKLVIEFDFPISLETQSGEIISVINNYELENTIISFSNSCDENDEVEFDESDFPFEDLITSQDWEVSFYSDTTDETSSFNTYIFSFKSDHSIEINTGMEIIYGDWELYTEDEITLENALEIEFDTDEIPFVWLNESWIIKNKSTSLMEMESESDYDGYIKKLKLIKSE